MTAGETVRSAGIPSRIAVTGAGGFIGGRLVTLLRREAFVTEVRALSRSLERGKTNMAVRLNDEAAVRKALAGSDALVHCAFNFNDLASNIEIARVLGRACAAAGIRLIHLSTAAVYEPLPNGDVNERSPAHAMHPYAATKIAIERELERCASDLGLDVVILQPTIVYGPAGRAWTDSPIRELLFGGIALPKDGKGLCNAVYVDDVCQAATRALSARVPSAERFLISGPAPVEWREFLGGYDQILGGHHLRCVSDDPRNRMQTNAGSIKPLTILLRIGRRAAANLLRRFILSRLSAVSRSRLNIAARKLSRAIGLGVGVDPGLEKMTLYAAECRICIDKARALLNYLPEFDLQRGMAATQGYVEQAYGQYRPRSHRSTAA